ncbi:MAG: hypothetical protein WC489_02355 [Patescibacteria group bacterium]
MAHPELVRIVHDHSYQAYLTQFKISANIDRRWNVDAYTFKDGTPSIQVMVGPMGSEEELQALPPHIGVMPFWISSQFNRDFSAVIFGVAEIANALRRRERSRGPLVERLIAACPYCELRQDKDGGKGTTRTVGEPNIPQIIGKSIGGDDGVDEMVLLGAHSFEAVAALRKYMKVVPVTATPLFAEYVREELFQHEGTEKVENVMRLDPTNVRIVALDKGSLQQNVVFSQMLDLDPADHVIAFDKTRKGENMVDKCALIYGDMTDLEGKDIIIYDDIIDTYGSIDATVESLKDKFHCRSITVLATHGVLSHPGRRNIVQALLKNHSIDRLVMTDSLPRANYLFDDDVLEQFITIIPTASILGSITGDLARGSYEEIISPDYQLANFILDPLDKEDMWNYFQASIAKKEKIKVFES